MTAALIDGKKVSIEIQEEIALEVAAIKNSGGKIPHLAAVLVGNDGASETYVAAKVKACESCGFKSTLVRLAENTTEAELLMIVEGLNNDPDIDGYIVQLPLPKHINDQKIIEAINPKKDVDGFHPQSVGRMALNLPTY
jgi:methylenetetrahydrofolate dehydrogenase (NADP+)/methenyltetrahydrofolate cyclohydrolase